MKKLSFLFFLFFFVGCGSLSSLKTLIELGKSDRIKEKALREETESFLKLKEAIDKGQLTKGFSKKKVIRLYGEPVIIIPQTQREKWAYKKSSASWFKGEKIYLFFNNQGRLVDWELKRAP